MVNIHAISPGRMVKNYSYVFRKPQALTWHSWPSLSPKYSHCTPNSSLVFFWRGSVPVFYISAFTAGNIIWYHIALYEVIWWYVWSRLLIRLLDSSYHRVLSNKTAEYHLYFLMGYGIRILKSIKQYISYTLWLRLLIHHIVHYTTEILG